MIKKLLLLISICLLILIGVFAATVLVLYNKQDAIVQELLTKANADFAGKIELRDSHIALFHDFPYISIDLENVKVFETKNNDSSPIVNLNEVYVGFDLWTIINGKTEIKKIDLEHGRIDLIQYPDGELNLAKAFATQVPVEDTEEEFHLHLKQIEITDVDISKSKPDADLMVDVNISEAATSFKSDPEHIYADLDSKFELSIILEGDTTFIKHKHFEFETELDYSKLNETLVLSPTTAKLEGALFETGGTIDFKDDVYVDLKFSGNKPNFDLFLAVAPPELAPALKKYQNKGQIFFEATIQGKTANGNSPAINARFGCEHAFFNNTEVDKKLDELNFSGYFTNGDARNTSTMEFGIKDFSARPEAGTFRGNLLVKNFDEPEINLQLDSDFDLNFLAKFFGLTELYNLNGKVNLITNFHDIISLEHPEKSIEKLNESYFTQLKIDNLSFNSTDGDVAKPLGSFDAWVIHINDEGHLIWSKTFGGADFDVANAIKKVSNGNFVVVGNTRGSLGDNAVKGENDFWAFEIDNKANSSIYWQKTFGGSKIDVATDFYQTPNKELILIGESQSNDQDVTQNKGINDLWVLKIK